MRTQCTHYLYTLAEFDSFNDFVRHDISLWFLRTFFPFDWADAPETKPELLRYVIKYQLNWVFDGIRKQTITKLKMRQSNKT